MDEYLLNCKIRPIEKGQEEIKIQLNQLLKLMKPENDLWDNSDMMRNWKVSERLLADWRSKKLIGYVKVNGKIWYTKEAREGFLNTFFIKPEK